MTLLDLATAALRDPDALARQVDADLAHAGPRALALGSAGAALFGLAVGSFHDPTQAVFAAVKLPILVALPPLLVLPAVHAACRAGDAPVPWRTLASAAIAGVARTGLLAAGLAPALWLPFSVDFDYFAAVLLFAASLVGVGLPGLAAIARAVPRDGEGRLLAMIGAVLLLGLVTAQTGWLLRPFVVRPDAPVAFLRPVEGDIFSALSHTGASAVGARDHWNAESAGLVNR